MSTRSVSQMTAQEIHAGDLTNPYVIVDGVYWEIVGLRPVFTREPLTSLILFGESDSVSDVLSTFARTEQREDINVPGMLFWLRRGDTRRLALASGDYELDIEA